MTRRSHSRPTPVRSRRLAFATLGIVATVAAVTAAVVVVGQDGCRGDERSDSSQCATTATATVSSPTTSKARFSTPATPTRSASHPVTAASEWPHPGDGVTGLPAGWKPKKTYHDSLVVRNAGSVIQDVEVIGGDIEIHAPNVTVRRVRVTGGGIGNWWDKGCDGTLTIESAEILGAGPTKTLKQGGPVIGPGSYVARHVLIDGVTEGFRVGGSTAADHHRCGPATVIDSFVRVVEPVECQNGPPYPDWHGDGLQGYGGAEVTVKHSTIQMLGNPKKAPCEGTAPFFWPDQGNGPAHVNGLLVIGGASLAFRLWTPGDVRGLLVAKGYGDVEVGRCDKLTAWDAHYAAVDLRTYAVGHIGPKIPCRSAA